MDVLQRFTSPGGADLTILDWDGEPVILCEEWAAAIGYADPRRLLDNIRRRWGTEFTEGLDFIAITGPELTFLKGYTSLVSPSANSAHLLTESGANLAAIKARTDQGNELRRWLATEVMPSLRKTGTYSIPGRQVPAVPPEMTETLQALASLATSLRAMVEVRAPVAVQETPSAPPQGYLRTGDIASSWRVPVSKINAMTSALRTECRGVYGTRYDRQGGRFPGSTYYYSPAEVILLRDRLRLHGYEIPPVTMLDLMS